MSLQRCWHELIKSTSDPPPHAPNHSHLRVAVSDFESESPFRTFAVCGVCSEYLIQRVYVRTRDKERTRTRSRTRARTKMRDRDRTRERDVSNFPEASANFRSSWSATLRWRSDSSIFFDFLFSSAKWFSFSIVVFRPEFLQTSAFLSPYSLKYVQNYTISIIYCSKSSSIRPPMMISCSFIKDL